MKRKLDKKRKRENLKTFLFSSFRQFNALKIKPLLFNCFTKRLTSKMLRVTIVVTF